MSKTQAFGYAAAFTLATLFLFWLAYALSAQVCACVGVFPLILAVIFVVQGTAKVDRDKRTAEQQIAQRHYEPIESGYGERAPQTTPGSSEIRLDFTKPHPPESV